MDEKAIRLQAAMITQQTTNINRLVTIAEVRIETHDRLVNEVKTLWKETDLRFQENDERFGQMRADMRESGRQTDEQLRSLALTVEKFISRQ